MYVCLFKYFGLYRLVIYVHSTFGCSSPYGLVFSVTVIFRNILSKSLELLAKKRRGEKKEKKEEEVINKAKNKTTTTKSEEQQLSSRLSSPDMIVTYIYI